VAVIRILEEVGIAVPDTGVWERLRSCGFRVKDGRIVIPRKQVSAFLETERRRNGDAFSEGPLPADLTDARITLAVSPYPQHVHDLLTDRIVPFGTAQLVEATRLVDVLWSRGVVSGAPGCPADVPPPLQPVVQYWIGATYARHGGYPVDPKSAESIPYVMEMGEALGNPLQRLPIYVFSPLTLGGESLSCALRFQEKLAGVHVSDMTSLGCTAPIRPGDAYALCVAEVIGSALLVQALVEVPVSWSIRLCPIDMSHLTMGLGSPEDFLLQLANAEVNAYFHGTRWSQAAGSIHTGAKLPGAQACAEKSSLMTTGALLGARRFGVAGTLSLDEVFSAEQLLYDVEVRDHVQRLVKGMDGDCDPERCLEEVVEGVDQKGFLGLDSTLDAYRDVYWHPQLFERRFLSGWKEAGEKSIRQEAHATIRTLLDQYEYELEADLQRELDRILAAARKAFT
jgi:trimethylamine:corrinoid methyltransferase-like protein